MTIFTPTPPTMVMELLLRPLQWPEEAQLLVDINNASRLAGGSLGVLSVELMRAYYDHLVDGDLDRDLRLAEVAGRPVGYVRAEWADENRGDRVHSTSLFVTPQAPAGSFAILLDWGLTRHLKIAAEQGPVDRPRIASISTITEPPEARVVLAGRGFLPVRYGFEMLRPTLDDLPGFPLPAGLEARRAERSHLRRIWQAETEAFDCHWGARADARSEPFWREFLADPHNRDTDLWQVAWDGDAIAGMVRPYIDAVENAVPGVRRGWCENISTRAPWRGRGVASALISRALVALRERGMTEAALGVDAQNETGALRLYERMGFREVSRETDWRRPLFVVDPPAPAAGS